MQPKSIKSALLALALFGFAAPAAKAQEAGASGGGAGSDAPGVTIFTPINTHTDQGLAVKRGGHDGKSPRTPALAHSRSNRSVAAK